MSRKDDLVAARNDTPLTEEPVPPVELEERPQAQREWRGAWRSVVVPLLAVTAIILSIWYLETKDLPFLGGPNASVSESQDPTFISLESQGIKLGASGGEAPKIGETAPDFTLLDLDGKVVRLSDFRGKIVVLNFWATWCVPCRQEFPELVNLYEVNMDRGLVVVGVNLREARGTVSKFAGNFGAKYPIVIDVDGSVASQYRVLGLPQTWFVDREGVLRSQVVGLLTKGILKANLETVGFQVPQ